MTTYWLLLVALRWIVQQVAYRVVLRDVLDRFWPELWPESQTRHHQHQQRRLAAEPLHASDTFHLPHHISIHTKQCNNCCCHHLACWGSRFALRWPRLTARLQRSNRKWRRSMCRPWKPHPRTKHEGDRMTRCWVMAIWSFSHSGRTTDTR